MLLRNQDRYFDMLQVDVAIDTRERGEAAEPGIACDGFFFEHDDKLFALGAEAGEIYVILDGNLIKFDARTFRTQLDESADCSTFTATQHFRTLCRVTYKSIKASGWIPNEDDECLDGFLWIHNVLQNPERLSLMIANTQRDE